MSSRPNRDFTRPLAPWTSSGAALAAKPCSARYGCDSVEGGIHRLAMAQQHSEQLDEGTRREHPVGRRRSLHRHLDDLDDHQDERDGQVRRAGEETHLALHRHRRAPESLQWGHPPRLAVRNLGQGVVHGDHVPASVCLDERKVTYAHPECRATHEHADDLGARDVWEQDAGRENDREEHEHPDDRRR